MECHLLFAASRHPPPIRGPAPRRALPRAPPGAGASADVAGPPVSADLSEDSGGGSRTPVLVACLDFEMPFGSSKAPESGSIFRLRVLRRLRCQERRRLEWRSARRTKNKPLGFVQDTTVASRSMRYVTTSNRNCCHSRYSPVPDWILRS